MFVFTCLCLSQSCWMGCFPASCVMLWIGSTPTIATASKLESEFSSCGFLCAPGINLCGLFLWVSGRSLLKVRSVSLLYWVKCPLFPYLAAPIFWERSTLNTVEVVTRGSSLTSQICFFVSWSAAYKNHLLLCSDH